MMGWWSRLAKAKKLIETKEPPLCRDCLYCSARKAPMYARCMHPVSAYSVPANRDPVTGIVTPISGPHQPFCQTERKNMSEWCGPSGRRFEPAEADFCADQEKE